MPDRRPILLALALVTLPLPGLSQAAPPPPGESAKAASAPETDAEAARRPLEGTKLLFLRLNLRIKLIEREFTDLSPEQFNEHLSVAADLLQQLNDRPLIDEESARADRAAQYLQTLVGTWLQLHRAS